MKLLIATGIWLVIIQIFVLVHHYVIENRKKTPFHVLSFILCVALSVILSWQVYDSLTFRVISVIYLGLMYWILFNLELNLVRKKPPLHLGTASILDRFEASLKNPGMTLGLKITLMIMCSFILLDIQWP